MNTIKFVRSLLLLTLLILTLFSSTACRRKKPSLIIKSIQTYGDNNENIMANITDIDFYKKRLYILDSQQKIIFKFALNGKLLKKIHLRSGRGPGEFTMGLLAFKVINDNLIAISDQLLKSVQLIKYDDNNYSYINDIKLNFNPYTLFYKDSLLFISGDALDYAVYVYDLNGKIHQKIQPQFLLQDQPTPWYPVFTVDDDNSVYITNPYRMEIIKRNKIIKWHYEGNKNFIEPPKIMGKGGMGQLKGWESLFVFKRYLIASTYNIKRNKEREKSPQIIVLNKTNGDFILRKNTLNPFIAKSFLNGEYIFKIIYEPFPSVHRIQIKIINLIKS